MKEQAELLTLLDKLKKSEDKYRQLIEQASDAIYILSPGGQFTNVNESMCRLLGYCREEFLMMNIADIVDPEQLKVDPLKYVGPFEPETSTIRERRFVHKNGVVFDVEINVKTFPNDRVMVIARDITIRRAMERELKNAELKFRTIAECSMVGVYIVQDGKFVYTNPRFAEVFGYQPAELTGKFPIQLLIKKEYRDSVSKSVRERLNDGIESVHYETMGVRKDGTTNWVEFYGSKVVMSNVPSIIGTMLDITERKNAEEQIQKERESLIRSEANLQTILNNTDTAYALLSTRLDIIEYNNLALEYAKKEFNYTPDLGNNLLKHLPKERVAKFSKYIKTVLNGTPVSYEISYPEPQGYHSWYYVRIFPIADKQQKILGLILAVTDITDRKHSEQKLQLAYKHISQHVASIQNMAWKQSHLMRSPIANLKALTSLLKADPGDTTTLNHIITELDRLDNIIVDMSNEASEQTVFN